MVPPHTGEQTQRRQGLSDPLRFAVIGASGGFSRFRSVREAGRKADGVAGAGSRNRAEMQSISEHDRCCSESPGSRPRSSVRDAQRRRCTGRTAVRALGLDGREVAGAAREHGLVVTRRGSDRRRRCTSMLAGRTRWGTSSFRAGRTAVAGLHARAAVEGRAGTAWSRPCRWCPRAGGAARAGRACRPGGAARAGGAVMLPPQPRRPDTSNRDRSDSMGGA